MQGFRYIYITRKNKVNMDNLTLGKSKSGRAVFANKNFKKGKKSSSLMVNYLLTNSCQHHIIK